MYINIYSRDGRRWTTPKDSTEETERNEKKEEKKKGGVLLRDYTNLAIFRDSGAQ